MGQLFPVNETEKIIATVIDFHFLLLIDILHFIKNASVSFTSMGCECYDYW